MRRTQAAAAPPSVIGGPGSDFTYIASAVSSPTGRLFAVANNATPSSQRRVASPALPLRRAISAGEAICDGSVRSFAAGSGSSAKYQPP